MRRWRRWAQIAVWAVCAAVVTAGAEDKAGPGGRADRAGTVGDAEPPAAPGKPPNGDQPTKPKADGKPPAGGADHAKDKDKDKGKGKDKDKDKGEPAPLPPPPGDAKGAKEPEPAAKPKTTKDKRKAYLYVLDPNSVVKTKGPENSVVARGKLQMVIPDDEVILYCNAVDYTGETTGIATLTGDLKIVTGKIAKKDGLDVIPTPTNVITGDIAYVFTKEKRAVIDEHVVVVHYPKDKAPPDADRVQKAKYDVTTLYCDRLTYWYRKGDRKAVAQPRLPATRIRFEQKTRRGTAGMGTYYDFEEGQSETGDVLDLVGGVSGEDDDGQVVEAEVCRLYLDLDSSQWYNVKRVVVNLDEEERSPAEPGGPPSQPGGEKPPAGDKQPGGSGQPTEPKPGPPAPQAEPDKPK